MLETGGEELEEDKVTKTERNGKREEEVKKVGLGSGQSKWLTLHTEPHRHPVPNWGGVAPALERRDCSANSIRHRSGYGTS